MAQNTPECESLEAMCHEVSLMHRLSQAVHEAVVYERKSSERGRIIPLVQSESLPPQAQVLRAVSKG